MSRNALTTVVAVVAAFSVGLTWSYFTSKSNGGVAVVDLDEVARKLGREAEMVQSVKNQGEQLNQRLLAIQQSAVKQLQEIRAGLGDEPTPQEAQEYLRKQRNAQVNLNTIKQQAEVALGQHRQQLISQFRQEAKPIAAKIAKEKGFTTVVTRNDSVVFSFDQGVDITDEVVALMSAQVPARPATKPAPKQETASRPAEPAAKPAPQTAQETPAGSETR